MESNNDTTVVVNGKPAVKRRKFNLGGLGGNKKRLALIGIIVAVVMVAGGILAWVLTSGKGISTETPVASVSIATEGFVPATIKIQEGQDVAWINEDEVAHEVYALQEDVPGLDSTEILATGDSYIYTFEEAGTFNYYDPLNPKFKGTVIVEE